MLRSLLKTEDWWALWLGLFVSGLGLLRLTGRDFLGWGVKFNEWITPEKALSVAAKDVPDFAALPGWASLGLTFLVLACLFGFGAWVMGKSVRSFLLGFSVVFSISALCLFLGNNAYLAATPNKRADFGIDWSLGLTGEAGYILALAVGLAIGNFSPGLVKRLADGARSEWFIKTAIVILGVGLGIKAADAMQLASAILFRGFAAIIEAYLIYWALVYFIARRYFGFSREWAAPLASGISICGVSAAIATGAAIRARPVVPIMVSSLVVVFAVVELVLLPFLAQHFLFLEPLVAAAWMGLAIKTDGAALAGGAITQALIQARTLEELGISYEDGWMLMTTTTIKMFIDVFIGVWSFLLALIWVYRINRKEGEQVRAIELWDRFPKFILGYAFLFVALLSLALARPDLRATLRASAGEIDLFRTIFFAMTFFSIGLSANFKRLWAEGLGRLALVYVVCLFGFIIWIGLAISWIFFHGVHPPTI